MSWYAALATLIPAVVMTAFYEIFKAITRPKSDKKRTKN
jgi:hypothetical protein